MMKSDEALTPRQKLLAYALECAEATRGWEGEMLSSEEVTQRFGIEAAALDALRSDNKAISFDFPSSGVHFPTKQFVEGGVLPALDELIAIVGTQGETWRWLLQNCTAFGEVPPLDLLKQGRAEEVITEAHTQYYMW